MDSQHLVDAIPWRVLSMPAEHPHFALKTFETNKTMIHLDLTSTEEAHLQEEVEKRLLALEHEIAHTESLNFKAMLKLRREAIKKFLAKLAEATAATS